MSSPAPVDVATAFVARINDHDVAGLAALMPENHTFTDSAGNAIAGRDKMQQGWVFYFKLFPDYAIEVTEAIARGNEVALFGKARGTLAVNGKLAKENFWEIPAAWRARIADSRVAEWQVYADNEPVRKIMAANAPAKSS